VLLRVVLLLAQVYNRALSDAERQVVEQYLATKYAMSGPHSTMSETVFASLPKDYITYGSRLLEGTLPRAFVCVCASSASLFHVACLAVATGNVTSTSLLTYAVNIQVSSLSFGLPLYVLVLEEAAGLGSVPAPSDCTAKTLCGGRRFYSFCYNGGTSRIHCDETIDCECHALCGPRLMRA
jgi:hypothetical protein